MLKSVISIVLLVWGVVSCAPASDSDIEAGIAGAATLAVVSGEANIAACPNGGIELEYGIDANANAELEKTEIAGVKVICNGKDGVDGIATNMDDYATLEALAGVALSGDYAELKNLPDLSAYVEAAGLSRVATTGNYEDLLNAPDLVDYPKTTELAQVAFSGSYLQLRDTPDFTNIVKHNEISALAISGDFSDMLNAPDMALFAAKADLAPVAMTGDYADLANKPDFALQSSLAAVAETGDYADLNNLPESMSLLADAEGHTSIEAGAMGYTNSLVFNTANTPAMVLNGTGHLGLGTTTPEHPLHIVTEELGLQSLHQAHYTTNNTWHLNTADVAQSFMVSENGNISQIDFLIDTVGQGTLTLAIYKGDGVAGTKVYQQEISGMVEGWNSFELNQPVAANAGETFTFQLSASEAGTVLEYCDGWAFDCYEAGNLHWWQGAGNSDDYSLAFKVFIAGITEANPVVVTAAGQLGLGTATPKAPIHVNNGDVYLDTIGKGVILKSANGSCWRWTPANDGSIQSESVACP